MDYQMLIKLLISVASLTATTLLTFSIFKIPIKDNDKQIALIGFFLGLSNFYFKFILESQFSFLIVIMTYFVLLILFKGYPVFFALVVCISGMLTAGMVDLLISYSGIAAGLTTVELMQTSFKHYTILNSCSVACSLLVSVLLRKFNFGFNLIISRFSGKYSLKLRNFIWLALLLAGGLVAELSVLEKDSFTLYGYILASLYIIFAALMAYTAIQNKKSVDARNAAEKGGMKKND